MATFEKTEVVEAEKYEGPALTVVHDVLGEQKAVSGDYLVGMERGKIRVMSAKQFEAEYRPHVAPEKSTDPDEDLDSSKFSVSDTSK